jgi:hypothetical protein
MASECRELWREKMNAKSHALSGMPSPVNPSHDRYAGNHLLHDMPCSDSPNHEHRPAHSP